MKVGLDAIQFDVPNIYLPIETLAIKRAIEPDKLIKGLGLQKMSLLEPNQDVVTMAANATFKLLQQEGLQPDAISKIVVGTESSLDNSKPIASYLISLLETQFGENSFQNCDVFDVTFACIGAVDALQSCVDFVRLNPSKKAIVVATDNAKYDLNSSGEYTQGAGAVAMLITANPKIIAFSEATGVASNGVFDFFKPKQTIEKQAITGSTSNENWFDILETEITIIKEQPVFDGHYSNSCYISRISEAYLHYKKESKQEEKKLFENWKLLFMHLPYCFQARRTFIDIFASEMPELLENQAGENQKERIKNLAKSPEYIKLITEIIQPSEIASSIVGNIYTGSIFLGLLSGLYAAATKNQDLISEKTGFIAYGSGSKSKVFEGEIQENWKESILKTKLFERLQNRTAIPFETYEQLHKKEIKTPISIQNNEFVLDFIEKENPVLKGARYYKFIS